MVASCLANMENFYIQKYVSHGITPNPKNRNKFIFAFCAWCEKSWLSDIKKLWSSCDTILDSTVPLPTVPETLITIHLHVQHQTPCSCTLKLLNLCKSRNAFFVDLLINMWKSKSKSPGPCSIHWWYELPEICMPQWSVHRTAPLVPGLTLTHPAKFRATPIGTWKASCILLQHESNVKRLKHWPT